jgi:hypothetical protein
VANLQDLIAFVTAYGASYNPSKNALKLPQLTALATASQASLGLQAEFQWQRLNFKAVNTKRKVLKLSELLSIFVL